MISSSSRVLLARDLIERETTLTCVERSSY
jgi:hypothetical protein